MKITLKTRKAFVFLAGCITCIAIASDKITNHQELQDALRDNEPPTGYVDLSNCITKTIIGDIPWDKQTYRLSFKKHFSFNLKSKIITSVSDTVLNNSRIIESQPILSKVPATIFVTSSPTYDHLRYQITIENKINATLKHTKENSINDINIDKTNMMNTENTATQQPEDVKVDPLLANTKTIKRSSGDFVRVYECPWKQAVYLWR